VSTGPISFDQLVIDDLDHHLARVQALDHFGPKGGVSHVFAELLDDIVVDVGLEQRLAHVVHGVGDVRLGDPPRPDNDRKTELNFSVNDSNTEILSAR